MNRDDQRIMPGCHLNGAPGEELSSVSPRDDEFARALQRDGAENEFSKRHAVCRSVTQLAVKPGPSAVNSERAGSPFARACSSTNNTVGDDMLPKSAIICRSWESVPWSSASAPSNAQITFAPPGWQMKRSMSSTERRILERISVTAELKCLVTKSGIVRRKM